MDKSATILIVEDDENIRTFIRYVLEKEGYEVVEATTGVEAIEACQKDTRKFDMLLSDVVMPQMGGKELAEKLAQKFPDLAVLFISGHTEDEIARQGLLDPNVPLLYKPFSPVELTGQVRALLDQKK